MPDLEQEIGFIMVDIEFKVPIDVTVLESEVTRLTLQAVTIQSEVPSTGPRYFPPPPHTNPGRYLVEAREAGERFLRLVGFLSAFISAFPTLTSSEKQLVSNQLYGATGIPAIKNQIDLIKANALAYREEGKPFGGGFPAPFDTKAAFAEIKALLEQILRKLG